MRFPSSMRRWIAALFLLSLSLAAVAAVVVTRFEGPPIDTTAALVPADAEVYLSFFVDPSSVQKRSLASIVGDTGGEADVASLVEGLLDRVTRAYGLPYEEVRPWIDRQMAFFALGSGAGAVIVEVADQEAAREAVERVGGSILGDHAVFGDDAAVRTAETVFSSKRDISLRGPDSFSFEEAMSDVPEDRLAFAISDLHDESVDLPPRLDALELLLGVGGGNAVALRASGPGLSMDGFSYSDGAILLLSGEDDGYKDLSRAGADAWLAAVVPNLSGAVKGIDRELRQARRVNLELIERLPLPAAVEGTDQTMVWVSGDGPSNVSGGVDATTDGSEASGRLARALAGIPGADLTFEFGRNRLRATIGDPRGRLGSNDRYLEAEAWLGNLEPIGYLDVDRAGTLIPLASAATGLTLPTWVEHVDRVVVGIDDQGPTHWRVVVSLS